MADYENMITNNILPPNRIKQKTELGIGAPSTYLESRMESWRTKVERSRPARLNPKHIYLMVLIEKTNKNSVKPVSKEP